MADPDAQKFHSRAVHDFIGISTFHSRRPDEIVRSDAVSFARKTKMKVVLPSGERGCFTLSLAIISEGISAKIIGDMFVDV